MEWSRYKSKKPRISWKNHWFMVLSKHLGRKEGRKVTQSCLTLCDPMDCSRSSVHGIFQAIVLEWIAISFSRGSSQPRDRTQVSCIVDRCFTVWATREVYQRLVFVFVFVFKALKNQSNKLSAITHGQHQFRLTEHASCTSYLCKVHITAWELASS